MRIDLSTIYVEELLAVVGTVVIVSISGCSSLSKNQGDEAGMAATQAAAPATPNAAVGLPGVIESAEASKTDANLSQAQHLPFGAAPELQQKFDNLQNRFNTRVDQTQAQVDQSIRSAQEQAARNIADTQNRLQNQAVQLQNQAMTQAQRTQLEAQKRLAEIQAQARRKVVDPLSQAAQQADQKATQTAESIDRSIEKAAQTVDQAKSKAATATGRFLDSLLPESPTNKP